MTGTQTKSDVDYGFGYNRVTERRLPAVTEMRRRLAIGHATSYRKTRRIRREFSRIPEFRTDIFTVESAGQLYAFG